MVEPVVRDGGREQKGRPELPLQGELEHVGHPGLLIGILEDRVQEHPPVPRTADDLGPVTVVDLPVDVGDSAQRIGSIKHHFD